MGGGSSVSPGRACRALRVPFLGASVLPFAAGLAQTPHAHGWTVWLPAVAAVGAVHLAANLANELADAASGADAQDLTPYGLFGGSKLLPRGEVAPSWYVRATATCLLVALACLLWLTTRLRTPWPAVWGGVAAGLALAYSLPPLQLMRRGLGEPTVALLFGPATVLAGWFAGTSAPPAAEPWLLAAVLGLLTAAVLVANEVPDAEDDARVGKRHLVVRLGAPRGWILYAGLCYPALLALATLAVRRRSPLLVVAVGLCALLAALSTARLRAAPGDKRRLLLSSRLTVLAQAAAALLATVDGWTGGAP